MQFNIRAISLAESIASDARVGLEDLVGAEVEFRQGFGFSVTLPKTLSDFDTIADPTKALTVLAKWSRVFKYPELDGEMIHVLAPADDGSGGIVFYRADFRQPARSRRGLRPAVQLVGAAVADYEACAAWLVELAYTWEINPDPAQRRVVLWRPRPIPPLH
jgi:hypothetical protein